MFSLVCALPSPDSAEACASLFDRFTGTMAQSDFSCTCMSAVRFMAFADRSWSVDQDVQEISRFSCMLFLSVRGFLDYAGPIRHSRLAWLSCCLPPYQNGVGILIQTGFSKLNSPAHRYLCLRFKRDLAVSPARLEARMESLSPFLQGSFIPYNMPVYPGALRFARRPSPYCTQLIHHPSQPKLSGLSASCEPHSHRVGRCCSF